jgi:hypothetical protein
MAREGKVTWRGTVFNILPAAINGSFKFQVPSSKSKAVPGSRHRIPRQAAGLLPISGSALRASSSMTVAVCGDG